MTVKVFPSEALAGSPKLPADKSIAHRAAILAALGNGESEIIGYSEAADPQSTLSCLRALGVQMEERDDSLFVRGVGLGGLMAPSGPLDCGNSGTTMRLLAGVLAGQSFDTVLVGDESLSPRPMGRIAEPLRQMGARIELEDGHAPILIRGSKLSGLSYRLPIASAQVKSAVLLAGLHASGSTTVIEPVQTRDHTERMLEISALSVGAERHLTIDGGHAIRSRMWVVPRDVSAAAFFMVAGSTAENSVIEMTSVGLNPTRSAVMDVLGAMGAAIHPFNLRERGGEPLGDIRISASGGLHGVEIGGDLIPNLIDEIPVLAVAAACAQGRTVIKNAAELRVKETDRISATAAFLRAMGATVAEREDGMVIDGGSRLHGAVIDSNGDHRIAMAAAIAALSADTTSTIHGAEAAAVSFPGFWDALNEIASGSVETV